MARHWKEGLDPARHRDEMAGSIGGLLVPAADALIERWAYFVAVAGFTFRFVSLAQIRTARDHFGRKIHPSGRIEHYRGHRHWYHPWHERLPIWLFEGPKRVRVVRALRRALIDFGTGG